jgi:hypothetical protein
VDNQNLLTRVLLAGIPLLVIALIAGAAGYVTKQADPAPVPELVAEDAGPGGVRGSVQSFSGDDLTIITAGGQSVKLRLSAGTTIETLTPIAAADLKAGDWVNGGAIQHATSVLALVGLVLIANPVVDTP